MSSLVISLLLLFTIVPNLAAASQGVSETVIDLTLSGAGMAALAIFAFAYLLVICEEFLHLRKSKPVLMRKVSRAEWDTLLFFYGVILSVGGLAQFGYLAAVSHFGYQGLGATTANVLVGVISALVDNIPVMFAVLTMDPAMSHGQWLLVTLTAGVGGSLLSIGSAAGVALMGTARGRYTFGSHLRWTPAIGLGYAASVWLHLMINRNLF